LAVFDKIVNFGVTKVLHIMAVPAPPCETNACPDEPAVIGKSNSHVPAALCGLIVTVPELVPDNPKLPVVPDAPRTGFAVKLAAPTDPEGFPSTVPAVTADPNIAAVTVEHEVAAVLAESAVAT